MAEAEFMVGDVVKHKLMKGRFILVRCLEIVSDQDRWQARGEDGELHRFYDCELVAVDSKRRSATASKR